MLLIDRLHQGYFI